MDQTAILWLFGTLITVLTIVIGAIGRMLFEHIRECREVQRTLGQLSTLPEEIRLIRKHLHDERNARLKRLANRMREEGE